MVEGPAPGCWRLLQQSLRPTRQLPARIPWSVTAPSCSRRDLFRPRADRRRRMAKSGMRTRSDLEFLTIQPGTMAPAAPSSVAVTQLLVQVGKGQRTAKAGPLEVDRDWGRFVSDKSRALAANTRISITMRRHSQRQTARRFSAAPAVRMSRCGLKSNRCLSTTASGTIGSSVTNSNCQRISDTITWVASSVCTRGALIPRRRRYGRGLSRLNPKLGREVAIKVLPRPSQLTRGGWHASSAKHGSWLP